MNQNQERCRTQRSLLTNLVTPLVAVAPSAGETRCARETGAGATTISIFMGFSVIRRTVVDVHDGGEEAKRSIDQLAVSGERVARK